MLIDFLRSLFSSPRTVSELEFEVAARSEAAAQYDPSCFRVDDLSAAKNIILTPEGMPTDERWQRETPVVAKAVIGECLLGRHQLVLDYGCGVGRIAKELIAQQDVFVIGVDISESMRRLSVEYVDNGDRFLSISPDALDSLLTAGLRVDAAYSVWVLQHCNKPDEDIARIQRALKPGGMLHVINNRMQAIPTDVGWADGGVDIHALLKSEFEEMRTFLLPEEAAAEILRTNTFCATFCNTAAPSVH